jgi:hypothetical protein
LSVKIGRSKLVRQHGARHSTGYMSGKTLTNPFSRAAAI